MRFPEIKLAYNMHPEKGLVVLAFDDELILVNGLGKLQKPKLNRMFCRHLIIFTNGV